MLCHFGLTFCITFYKKCKSQMFSLEKFSTNNNKLLFWMFFCICKQKILEHFINTLNIAETYTIWLSKKGISFFVWFVKPNNDPIHQSYWLKLKKKPLVYFAFAHFFSYINFENKGKCVFTWKRYKLKLLEAFLIFTSFATQRKAHVVGRLTWAMELIVSVGTKLNGIANLFSCDSQKLYLFLAFTETSFLICLNLFSLKTF